MSYSILSGSIPCFSSSNCNNLISASGSIPCLNPLGSPLLSSFGGKLANPTTQIKQFLASDNQCCPSNLWAYQGNLLLPTLTPINQSPLLNILIPGDLTVMGSIIHLSDEKFKKNIHDLHEYEFNQILDLKPKSFSFKKDVENINHYGFIAQDLEKIIPCLVSEDKDNKYINYLELIPLMIGKIQLMQEEINDLKQKLEK